MNGACYVSVHLDLYLRRLSVFLSSVFKSWETKAYCDVIISSYLLIDAKGRCIRACDQGSLQHRLISYQQLYDVIP